MKRVKSNVINSHLKVFLSGCFPIAMFHFLVLVYDSSLMSVTASVLELMKIFAFKAKECSEPCQAYRIVHFAKIINTCKLLTIFAKYSILEVWQGSEYTCSKNLTGNPGFTKRNTREIVRASKPKFCIILPLKCLLKLKKHEKVLFGENPRMSKQFSLAVFLKNGFNW